MKLFEICALPLVAGVSLLGCSDPADTVDETEDGAEEVADETGDAAEEVADETGDAAEGVGEEAEEAVDDADAAIDCANVCEEQQSCDDGIHEEACLEFCEDVAIEGENNQEMAAVLDDCDDCVDAADDSVCDSSGAFVCGDRCAMVIGQ